MLKVTVHKKDERGKTLLSWLTSYHSFSFGTYHNKERYGFGALQVLNDDIIAVHGGFPSHPHEDMEIITIPLTGELRHEDSMGNHCILKKGDVQIMSAGKGVVHSEYNNSPHQPLELLQLWISPQELQVTPRHQERNFLYTSNKNILYEVAAPTMDNNAFVIYQNAYVYLGAYEPHKKLLYNLHNENNGVFIFVIEGEALVDVNRLKRRDSIEITGLRTVTVDFTQETEILLIEVPLS